MGQNSNFTEINRIIGEYYKQLYNLDEMDKFLEKQKLTKLTQEEIENYESALTSKENESVIKVLPTKKNPDGFKGGFKTFKEELTPILLKLFQKTEEGTHSVSSARQRHQKKRKLQTMSLININAKPLNEY